MEVAEHCEVEFKTRNHTDMKVAEHCEGGLISIKNYSLKHGISYQAVAQQVRRYSAELDGHIVKQGKTRYLDEVAEAFLDEKRSALPVTVYAKGEQRQIEELKEKIATLQDKLDASYEMLIAEQRKTTELLEQNTSLQLMIAESKTDEAEPDRPKGNRLMRALRVLIDG